jgi:hypothetical protein
MSRTIAEILQGIDDGVQLSQSDLDVITGECERLSDEIVSDKRERAIRADRIAPKLLGALLDECTKAGSDMRPNSRVLCQ